MKCVPFVCMFLLACDPVSASAQTTGILGATIGETEKSPEVSTEYVRKILSERSSTLVDTRPRAEFVNGHIPGAHNPNGTPAEVVQAITSLVGGDKTKELVLYCNGPFCQASRRLAAQLLEGGFTNVKRYQLGMPLWRALGGPTQIELEGFVRVHRGDQTAVLLDARSAEDFAKGTIDRAQSLTSEQAKTVQGKPMPLDDFNTRVIVFGRDAEQSRELAEVLSKRPWHNVSYFAGAFADLSAATR